MLRKICTIEDVKFEVMRYFETLYALPAPRRPDYAKNYMWLFIATENTPEDAENAHFQPTNVDIADCWYMDANLMNKLTKFEYDLLSARCREKPLPWKPLTPIRALPSLSQAKRCLRRLKQRTHPQRHPKRLRPRRVLPSPAFLSRAL